MRRVRSDSARYCAEPAFASASEPQVGTASEAQAQARLRAKVNLSNYLSTQIRSSISLAVVERQDSIVRVAESNIRAYSDVLLRTPEIIDFPGHPAPGDHSAIACVSRVQYDEQVEKDLQERRTAVLTPLRSARAADARGEYGAALRGYVDALQRKRQHFEELPLNLDVADSGQVVEVEAFVAARLRDILARVEVVADEVPLVFGPSGEPHRAPRLMVRHRDGERQRPIVGMQLRARVAEGNGRVVIPTLQSGPDGEVTVDLRELAPPAGGDRVRVVVEVDPERMGLDPALPVPTPVRLELVKERAVAVAAVRVVDGQLVTAPEFREEARRAVIERGFVPLDLVGASTAISEREIASASQSGADFVLLVVARISCQRRGSYALRECSGSAEVHGARVVGSRGLARVDAATTRASGSEERALAVLQEALGDAIRRQVARMQ